jgi:hypothetical protein
MEPFSRSSRSLGELSDASLHPDLTDIPARGSFNGPGVTWRSSSNPVDGSILNPLFPVMRRWRQSDKGEADVY